MPVQYGSANSRDKLVPIWVTQGGAKHPISASTMPHPVRHHMVLVPAGVGNNVSTLSVKPTTYFTFIIQRY